MAASFDSAGSNWHIDHGSGSSIDDLPNSGGSTHCLWLMRTADAGNQHFCTKDSASNDGFSYLIENGSGEGQVRCVLKRATTAANYYSSVGDVPLNTWVFLAIASDMSGSANDLCRIYKGTLTSLATDVTASNSDGSGAYISEAGSKLYIGNLERSTTVPFRGYIATCTIFNTRLSTAQIQAVQFNQFAGPNSNCVMNCIYHPTLGTQIDYSGNANNGTVTSATQVDHVPIGHPIPQSNVYLFGGAEASQGIPSGLGLMGVGF